MPTRSLNSSVLTWPDRQEIERALQKWVHTHVLHHPEVLRVGYCGSYARGDWGVGSDLDLIILLTDTEQPVIRRARMWDTLSLPVPTDVLVYTAAEWRALCQRHARIVQQPICWVYRTS
ncbi:MAG: nucleotidyltransferase domain-containing protein [Anaerolineae bacterium]